MFLEPAPQKAKSKQKRNLGILEMATKEFEDTSDVRQLIWTITFKLVWNYLHLNYFTHLDVKLYYGWLYYVEFFFFFLTSSSLHLSCFQQSGEDEAADNPTETDMKNPAETEPHLVSESAAASPQSTPRPEAEPQASEQETQAASNACQPPGGSAEAIDAKSKAHLFIFDSESQEEVGFQAASGDGLAPVLANLQPTVKTASTFSMTQAQLEEDKQRITKLMSDTKQVMMHPS